MTGSGFKAGCPLRVGTTSPGDGERSVVGRQPDSGGLMTAVPGTAANRASASRRAQQPLRGSQREYAWRYPKAPIAAKPSVRLETKESSG